MEEIKSFKSDNIPEEDQEKENQEQINLLEEDQEEESKEPINLEIFENVKYQKEIDFQSKEEKINNNKKITNKDICESSKYKYIEAEELPLPNINNLRKWIKNEKKAS